MYNVFILVHTDYPWPEGLSYRVHNMAVTLSRKYQVTVVSPILESDYSPGLESIGPYDIFRFRLKILRKLRADRILYRLFFALLFALSIVRLSKLLGSNRKIRLVQAEQQYTLLAGILAKTLLRTPLILDDALNSRILFGEIPILGRLFVRAFETIFLKKCKLILAGSEDVVRYLHEYYNIPSCRLGVVHNGVSPPHFSNDQNGKETKTKDIFFIGSMYSKQNIRAINNLLRIFPAISKEIPDARLLVAGGPLELLYEDTGCKAEKPQSGNVSFLGQVSEKRKAELLRTALVCPLPYDPTDKLTGGARLKALELLSYGKVIVSSPAGVEGIDGVINGKNLIISQNLNDLAKCITGILKHPDRYKKIGENAALLGEKYRWDNTLSEYENIVEEVLLGVR